MINLYELDRAGLENLLKEWGQPAFRANQVWEWVFTKRAQSFDEMTNLPKALRERLTAETRLGVLEVAAEQSSKDGTVKRLYKLADGQLIESVLMPYDDDRRTACIFPQLRCDRRGHPPPDG